MELLLDPNLWVAFAMLTALEIVLGVYESCRTGKPVKMSV